MNHPYESWRSPPSPPPRHLRRPRRRPLPPSTGHPHIVEQLELELDRSTLLWRLRLDVRCRGEWGLRVHGYVLLHESEACSTRCVHWCLLGITSATPSPASTRALCVAPNGYFDIVLLIRNRAFKYFAFSPSIRTWCWCLRWGIWVSGRSDQSFCANTDIFFRDPLPFSPGAEQDRRTRLSQS